LLTQVAAATKALQVASGLLDDHVRYCVMDTADQWPAARQAKLDELSVALRRAVRL
jgi:CsoR family transcriptional regulator, copper-sensing transcriptional repressor